MEAKNSKQHISKLDLAMYNQHIIHHAQAGGSSQEGKYDLAPENRGSGQLRRLSQPRAQPKVLSGIWLPLCCILLLGVAGDSLSFAVAAPHPFT